MWWCSAAFLNSVLNRFQVRAIYIIGLERKINNYDDDDGDADDDDDDDDDDD